jgi:hypothetical protein
VFSSQYVLLAQQINITATCQKLTCPVHSKSILFCMDICNGTFERQLEKDGDKASFSFRPFWIENVSNICLSVLCYGFHLISSRPFSIENVSNICLYVLCYTLHLITFRPFSIANVSNICLSVLYYRFRWNTFLSTSLVSWWYQTQYEFYIKTPP